MPRKYKISTRRYKFNKPDKRDYMSAEYKTFRKAVIKRDKRKCQMPGCKKTAKQIHHILRWADSVHLRYEPDNGISLCYDCHKSIKDKEHHFVALFVSIIKKKKDEDNKGQSGEG